MQKGNLQFSCDGGRNSFFRAWSVHQWWNVTSSQWLDLPNRYAASQNKQTLGRHRTHFFDKGTAATAKRLLEEKKLEMHNPTESWNRMSEGLLLQCIHKAVAEHPNPLFSSISFRSPKRVEPLLASIFQLDDGLAGWCPWHILRDNLLLDSAGLRLLDASHPHLTLLSSSDLNCKHLENLAEFSSSWPCMLWLLLQVMLQVPESHLVCLLIGGSSSDFCRLVGVASNGCVRFRFSREMPT